MPQDIGRFVGRYLQALGVLSLGAMLIEAIGGSFRFDVTFLVLLLAGTALTRHSALARKIVLVGSAMTIGASIGFAILARAMTSGGGISVDLFGRPIGQQPGWVVALAIGLLFLSAVVPLVLLSTRQARREFASD